METGESPTLGPSRCFARLFLSFTLHLAKCHYRNVKVTAKVYKPCLSFFISFSRLQICHVLFIVWASLPSLHWPLCTHRLYTRRMKRSQNLNSSSIIFYDSHNPYTQRTKPWQTWMASQSYFIVFTVRTCDVRNHDRLSLLWGLLRLASIIMAKFEKLRVLHTYVGKLHANITEWKVERKNFEKAKILLYMVHHLCSNLTRSVTHISVVLQYFLFNIFCSLYNLISEESGHTLHAAKNKFSETWVSKLLLALL